MKEALKTFTQWGNARSTYEEYCKYIERYIKDNCDNSGVPNVPNIKEEK